MIKLFSQGRLGNQMFQYAAALSANIRLKIPFEIISYGNDPFDLHKYFELGSNKKSAHHFKIENIYWKIYRKLFNQPIDISTLSLTNNNLTESKIQSSGKFKGFFQSLYYFEKIQSKIKREFKIKTCYTEAFDSKFKYILTNNETVCVHVRRGDYLKWIGYNKKTVSLPIYYYQHILEKIGLKNKLLIFISDDIEFCKASFSHLSDNVYFSEEDLITDFQLLQNSDYLILSNSSFSWWAAFLKTNAKSLVFAPNKWIGFDWHEEDPIGISYGLDWEWVDFSKLKNIK